MGYKGNSVQGEIPESGAIFMSNIKTHKECLERKLFGLPSGMSNFVLHVKEGMTLFLFEFERRLLYGVFRATCDGDINIEPKAFRSSGKQFPAQVRFTTVYECSPLAENEFKDVISDNYFSGKKFHFGLNKKQVSKLMKLFRSKLVSRNHSERNIRRYVDNPSEEVARSGDPRNGNRHRIRLDSCDSRGDEVKKVHDDIYINKHIIESRHYMTESDEFGDSRRRDILGKHLDLRKNDIEVGYMSGFSKPHGTHLDEIGYKRLQDEYNIREGEGLRGSLNEYPLTNHGDIRLSPCFDDGSGFIPIANSYPVYPSPEKLPMSKSHLHYSYDEGSSQNQYLDDIGSQSSIFPKFISRNLSSPNAGLRLHEVDPTYSEKRFFEKHDSKHRFGATDERVSVFSRLTMNLRHGEHAFESDEKHELNSSVDKVMKMLEKVVSSPKRRSGKNILVYKQDDADKSPDSKIEAYEFSNVNFEVDADMADEELEGELVFQETRLVDFKRRKKSNNETDGACKKSSECLVGATSNVGPIANDELMGMPRKRRRLVRPTFLVKNVIPDSVSANENTLSASDNVDVVLESAEKVDDIINMVPPCHENALSANTNADVVLESSKKVVDITKPMVPTCHENTLSANDNAGVVLESSKKVVDIIKPMVPTCHENTLSANDNADVVRESSEKVDYVIKSMVPTCHENTPANGNLTKAEVESSKKVDVSIKHIDLNMLPTCDESLSPKDDSNSTKVVLESQKNDNSIRKVVLESQKDDNNLTKVVPESQKRGNEGDGNAGSRLVSGVFVKGTEPEDDQNTCGWIEW